MAKIAIVTQMLSETSGGSSTYLLNLSKALEADVFAPMMSEPFDTKGITVNWWKITDREFTEKIIDLINHNYQYVIIYPGWNPIKHPKNFQAWENLFHQITIPKIAACLSMAEPRIYKGIEKFYLDSSVVGYLVTRSSIRDYMLKKKVFNSVLPVVIPPDPIVESIDLSKIDNSITRYQKPMKIVSMNRMGSTKRPAWTVEVMHNLKFIHGIEVEIHGWQIGGTAFYWTIKAIPEMKKKFDELNEAGCIKSTYQNSDIPQILKDATFLLDTTYVRGDAGGLQNVEIEALKNGVVPIMDSNWSSPQNFLLRYNFKDNRQNLSGFVDNLKFLTPEDRQVMVENGLRYINEDLNYDSARQSILSLLSLL